EGDWQSVYTEAYDYVTPITAGRADTHAGIDLHDMNITRDDPSKITYIPFPREGELPDTYSFVQVQGDGIVLSAMRRTKQGETLIRFFNIKREDTIATIRSSKAFASANLLNLNEDLQSSLKIDDVYHLSIPVRAGQIVTVGLMFAD